jgi:1-acyl-sn-glycerol-3-phosphate acyltransferase
VAPAHAFTAVALRIACGVRVLPESAFPPPPFVLFANHTSHLDFAVIWAALPPVLRKRVRPVAGRDYWEATRVRRWIATQVFHAVLIERKKVTVASNPLGPMLAAVDTGSSLIVFPEGTRSADTRVQPFKGGLHHLAHARPTMPLVPVLLENLNRILPKGDFLPVPLIASLTMGAPLTLGAGESRPEFLARAQHALESLRRS